MQALLHLNVSQWLPSKLIVPAISRAALVNNQCPLHSVKFLRNYDTSFNPKTAKFMPEGRMHVA
jgi:hypothetical protein